LAIPADEALRGRAGTLARGESAQSPRLGVAIAPNFVARRLRRAVGLPETDSLLIRDVAGDSPASRGVKRRFVRDKNSLIPNGRWCYGPRSASACSTRAS